MLERQATTRRPPARNTTAVLGFAYMSLGHRIVDGVNAAGYPQRPAHSAVMAHIDVEGGTRLTTIASRANVTPQAAGVRHSPVGQGRRPARRPDPDDRRAKRVVLTERGQACVDAALGTIASLEAELEDLLGPAAVADLHDTLSRIVAAGRTSRDAR